MRQSILLVMMFLSFGLFAAEKVAENRELPPDYKITITGDTVADEIDISLNPARVFQPGEKLKVIITDKCDNLVFYGEYFQSLVTIEKSDFLPASCLADINGNQEYQVCAYYYFSTGIVHKCVSVII